MERQRIVITGIGVVAPNGIGKEEFWKNCAAGISGIKPITLFDVSKYRCRYAGEISNFQPEKYLGSKGLRNLDRTTLLALVAAKLAIEDARLEITDENRNDVGVVLGSTMGSVHSISEFDKEGLREGPRYVNPAHFPNTVINSPASQVAIRFSLKGLNTTISTGFTASLDAIGYAMDMLRLGRVKTLFVGGVEELCVQTFLGFYKLGLLATSSNGTPAPLAPFGSEARGTLLGEGAAFFSVELFEDAERRGVRPLAELAGYGTYFNPEAMYRYDREGVGTSRAIHAALDDAGVSSAGVPLVNTSANGIRGWDETERKALGQVFSMAAGDARVRSTKSLIGETFSADGALRLAATLGDLAGEAGVVIEGSGPMGLSSAIVVNAGAPMTHEAVSVTKRVIRHATSRQS